MAEKVTTDIDFGAAEIERQAQLIDGSFVKIGLQGEKGQRAASGDPKSGKTVVDVGIDNEFGVPARRVPARSFIRSTFDNKNRQWSFLTKNLLGKILLRRLNTSRALSIIGLKIQSDIKRKIRSNVPPPNAESTLRRKMARAQKKVGIGPIGMPKTLIDTGRMLNSVIFVKTIK